MPAGGSGDAPSSSINNNMDNGAAHIKQEQHSMMDIQGSSQRLHHKTPDSSVQVKKSPSQLLDIKESVSITKDRARDERARDLHLADEGQDEEMKQVEKEVPQVYEDQETAGQAEAADSEDEERTRQRQLKKEKFYNEVDQEEFF